MPTEFGQWLRRARTHNGLSLMDLQDRTGINYTHISRMENGRSRPSRETVIRLAEAMNAVADEALLAAAYLPFDATHLTDPITGRIARRYHRLPTDLREYVDQALTLAEKMAEERARYRSVSLPAVQKITDPALSGPGPASNSNGMHEDTQKER